MTRWAIKAPPRRALPAGEVSQALDALRETLQGVAAVPSMNGELIEGVVLGDEVTTSIKHTLGRPFKGWKIVDEVGGLTPGRIRRLTGGNDAKELILRAYGFGEVITVSLEIF